MLNARARIASSPDSGTPMQPPPIARAKPHVTVDPRDQAFVAMLPAFRATGGLATGDEVGARIAVHHRDGLSRLARRIAANELISFTWRANLWLPMFQFDRQTMEMNPGAHQVVCELAELMDGWEITQWFATPHPALRDALPVEMLNSQREATRNAARLDRFIALG